MVSGGGEKNTSAFKHENHSQGDIFSSSGSSSHWSQRSVSASCAATLPTQRVLDPGLLLSGVFDTTGSTGAAGPLLAALLDLTPSGLRLYRTGGEKLLLVSVGEAMLCDMPRNSMVN